MRVLFVTNMWPDERRPAYGSFVKTQAASLRALGVEVDVMSIQGYLGKMRYVAAATRLGSSKRSGDYDVVHAHYGYSGVVARVQFQAPMVLSYCGADLLGNPGADGRVPRRSRVEVAVSRQLARVAAATITKSRGMAERLPADAQPRNHVIPNGVDLSAFGSISKPDARRFLGWDPDEASVLFVGNPANPRKNYDLAARVVKLLRAQVPSVRLRAAWEVAPEAIPIWMSAADALLFTSRSEGSPNVVKEAMASELPIVSTPVGDVAERVGGVPACFVRPAEVEPLAACLGQALLHGPVPEARRAIADLSLPRVARRVVSVYESVTVRRGQIDESSSVTTRCSAAVRQQD